MLKKLIGDILDVQTLAKYLDVAPITIYRLLEKKDKNEFPGHKVRGQWRFFKVDIDKWVREKR